MSWEALNARTEILEQIIQELNRIPGVIEAFLIDRSGIIIAPGNDKDAYTEKTAAMCAILSGAASAALDEFNKSGPDSIVVESKECVIVIADAGPKAILMVRKDGNDYIEELLLIAEAKSRRIKEILN